MTHLIHQPTRQILAQNVIKATSFLDRFKGLMGKKHFSPSDTLWIKPCPRGVHTFFMRFPLDLIFVDRFCQVTSLYQNIGPWKVVRPPGSFTLVPPSYSVFEFLSSKEERQNPDQAEKSTTDSSEHSHGHFTLRTAGKDGQNSILIQKGDKLYVGN